MNPQSLFFQIASLSPEKIVELCEHVRASHRDGGDDDIYNVTLTTIARTNGDLYTEKLAAIRPYLPGGSKQAFDNVFVGSALVPWGDAGNPYREGIQDAAFRWKNLILQRQVWDDFAALFPDLTWHPYIEYEAPLEFLREGDLRSFYEAYMVQSCIDANVVRPGGAVLWSPAFWAKAPLGMVPVLASFFSNVKVWSRTKGITWLHLQDMQGRAWYHPSRTDVVEWMETLRSAWSFSSLRVNMELFEEVTYQPADPAEVEDRSEFYRSAGWPVGMSWEARYWPGAHVDDDEPEPVTLVTPTEWGAQVDYTKHEWKPWAPDKFIVHYGGEAVRGAYDGVAREKEVLRAWERYHLGKGWLGIAYNYAIGMSGTTYLLRGEQRSGATSGDQEPDGVPENHEGRAVVFILGGDQRPTAEALAAFDRLYKDRGPGLPVIGHYWVKGRSYTACPGVHLDAFIRGSYS